MDRAAGHQLLDTFNSSYMPWKKAIEGIYKEEVMQAMEDYQKGRFGHIPVDAIMPHRP